MLTAANEEVSRLGQELEKFGVAKSSARIYVALLAEGEASANTLAKLTRVHRVDVYKRLENLLRQGFVTAKLGRPTIYRPSNPRFVLDQITEKKERELTQLSETRDWLLAEFGELRKVNRPAKVEGNGPEYQLIMGRRKGYDESKALVRSASTEISRVVSSNGLIRNYKFGVLEEYKNCVARGIRIRILANFSRVPSRITRFCGENFESRHLSDSSIRLLVVDRAVVLLSATFNDSEMTIDSADDRYLLIKDHIIASVLAQLFEQLWTSAIPVEQLL